MICQLFSIHGSFLLPPSGQTVVTTKRVTGCPAPPHRATLQVIRTMACEYALCSLFVPGDRQIILGTKVLTMMFICVESVSYFSH